MKRTNYPRKRTIWLLLCLVAWFAEPACRAETITWFCPLNSTNLTSKDAPMGGAFNFELGVFNGNFVPTSTNAEQWAANWVPAQRISYSEANKRFEGRFTVVNNNEPFTVGKAAYIWGFQTGSASSEWVLFRNPDWTWPAPNQMNPFGINWNADAATALCGSINASGSPFLMKAAAVTTWQQWRDTELAGEALNAPDQDPDLDGQSNLLEFVSGTRPRQAGAPPATSVEVVTSNSQKFQQITLSRQMNHLATLTVQVSPDLANWSSDPAATTVISETPAGLVVRDLTPIGSGGGSKRFMRLKAELSGP